MPTDFTLPELGENIAAGDVLRVLVNPGDTLAKDQPVLELETDKATIEVPSSVAGKIKEIKVKAGDKVKVGQAILTVDEGEASNKAEPAAEPQQARESQPREPEPHRQSQPPREPQPPRESQPAREPQPPRESQPPRETQATKTVAAKSESVPEAGGEEQREPTKRETAGDKSGAKVVDISRGARPPAEQPPATPEMPTAPAAPSVRRMARELGVDINQVAGSGDAGRISVEDVKNHAKRLVAGAARSGGVASEALPDFSRWGAVERQPMRAVRRRTAEHLAAAWAAIPHVTQFDVADTTALEELRKKYAKQTEAAGGNLTVTAVAVKVVASALRVFPQFNTSIDLENDEIIVKKYVNIGVAVDTDRGLLVPVIRNADQKNIIQIAVELVQLSEKARSRKIALEEMQGGTFSISNLGISRASTQPKFDGNQFVPRVMLPLSLSYDHRAIDGADGIRFLRWVVQAIEEPFVLALQG